LPQSNAVRPAASERGSKVTPLAFQQRQQHQEQQKREDKPKGPFRAARESSVRSSAAEPIGSGIVAPGEIQQFALGLRKLALGRDAAEPVSQLAVMRPGFG
jgi:hypothetical protein